MSRGVQNTVRLSLMGVLALSLWCCSASSPKSDSSSGADSGSTSGAASDNSSGGASGSTSTPDSTPSGDTGSQSDPNAVSLTAADWDVVYDGEGSVVFDSDGILMTPKAASVDGETHAALLLAKQTVTQPLQNFRATIKFTNVAQLRTGSEPNAWEVFWVFFNYTLDGGGKKMTNYVMIKPPGNTPPTGVEIGRAYNEIDQEFLVTTGTPNALIGTTYTMTVTKNGPHVIVLLDGQPAADFTSEADPSVNYIYDVPGAIGLYTEDAQVRVSSVAIEALP